MFKFKIDFTFIILLILIILSPQQAMLWKLLLVLVIHEMGHLFFILIFGIKINCLKLYSSGFFLDIAENDMDFFEGFFIYSGGILFNLLLYFMNINDDINKITLLLFFINILPIYPLDGYQLIKGILNLVLPVYYSEIIMNIVSFMVSILLLGIGIYNKWDLFLVINIFYLIILICQHQKNIKIYHYQFLLYKYLHQKKLKIRKIKFSESYAKRIYRFHNVITMIGSKKITENDLLMQFFNEN